MTECKVTESEETERELNVGVIAGWGLGDSVVFFPDTPLKMWRAVTKKKFWKKNS